MSWHLSAVQIVWWFILFLFWTGDVEGKKEQELEEREEEPKAGEKEDEEELIKVKGDIMDCNHINAWTVWTYYIIIYRVVCKIW